MNKSCTRGFLAWLLLSCTACSFFTAPTPEEPDARTFIAPHLDRERLNLPLLGGYTFTVPESVTSITVEIWGAGGSGGAGGYGKWTMSVSPGNQFPLTVNAGGSVHWALSGTSGIPGDPGSDTTFGPSSNMYVATGGGGGGAGTVSSGGSAGVGGRGPSNAGVLAVDGSPGSPGGTTGCPLFPARLSLGGDGGAAPFGAAGGHSDCWNFYGAQPGAGGFGGPGKSDATASSGQGGGHGQVKITW